MKRSTVNVRFETKLYRLKDWLIMALPADASAELPSRGQVCVDLTVGGQSYKRVLEPDGCGGHWLRFDDLMTRQTGHHEGDTVEIEATTNTSWPEPDLPSDLETALAAAPAIVQTKWRDITPMARWEWVRWIGATSSAETRAIRIDKTISKLEGHHRRPCCFNLAACTEPYLAKSGRLLRPSEA